jgi:hypothetical protein
MACVRLIGPQSIRIYIRNMFCYQNDRWEKFGKLLTKNALPASEENWKEVYIETYSGILKYFVPYTVIHFVYEGESKITRNAGTCSAVGCTAGWA